MNLKSAKQVNSEKTQTEDQKSQVILSPDEVRDIVLVFKLLRKWQKESKDNLDRKNKH